MEHEIDLSRYLRAIGRSWYWIILAALLGTIAAALWSRSLPKTYSASAPVFFRSTRSEVRLDERFVTNEMIDAASRRRGVVELAKSTLIETQLPKDTLAPLGLNNTALGGLASRIDIQTEGDLMTIVAEGYSPEEARGLADAWAATFVKFVNDVYTNGPDDSSTQAGVRDVQERYALAQKAYEEFVGSNRLPEIDQRIAAITGVLSQTLDTDQSRYNEYLERATNLELLLRDAEALRPQLADGQPPGLGDRLALLTLRARASSSTGNSSTELPVQLQIDQVNALGQDASMLLQELDALIEELRQEITATRTAASRIGSALASEAQSAESSLTSEQHASYLTQLQELLQQRESEEAKLGTLRQERDLALESVQIMQRKFSEQQLAGVRPDIEVRLAGSASLPQAPSGPQVLLWTAAGMMGGLMFGLFVVLALEAFGVSITSSRRKLDLESNISFPAPVEQVKQ